MKGFCTILVKSNLMILKKFQELSRLLIFLIINWHENFIFVYQSKFSKKIINLKESKLFFLSLMKYQSFNRLFINP